MEPRTLQQIVDEMPEEEQRRMAALREHAKARLDVEQRYLEALRLQELAMRIQLEGI